MQIKNFMSDMESFLDKPQTNDAAYLVVAIQLPDTPHLEFIVNPSENFKVKIPYYLRTYDQEGVMKVNESIKIQGYAFVHDLDGVMEFMHTFI